MFRRRVSWLYIMAMYHDYVSWLCIMAMYHGYVSWLCIMAMYHGYVSWLCITAMYHGYVYYITYITHYKRNDSSESKKVNFEKCFHSCFDSGFRIYVTFCEGSPHSFVAKLWKTRIPVPMSYINVVGVNL